MAKDILGITGNIDLEDIQRAFDAVIAQLKEMGVSTEELSRLMTKALTDIANTAEKDLSTKVKKSSVSFDEFAKHMQGVLACFDKLTQAIEKNTKAQEEVISASNKASEAEKQGADKATEAINKTGEATEGLKKKLNKTGDEGSDAFGKLVKAATAFFTMAQAVEFGRKIIEVRSEMESLQKSFESLAGEHIGRQLYEDIKQFATSTPMMMNELAKGAQTLLGFNIAAEKVMPILHQIGDISMGNADKFNSLTLAFAQMSSTGKLMGQDLLQMINAGFNPLVIISEKTGKSISKLKEEMGEGKISVEMVEEAFRAATEEGGKFHNMLEDQSKTTKGAISNMKGAYEDMLNAIGESSQGLIMTGVNVTTMLIKNYEAIGKILLQLTATYGAYKAALIANIALEKAQALSRLASIKGVTLMHMATDILTKKTAALNSVLLKNPYVLVATAVMSVISAFVIFRKRTDEVTEAQKRLENAFNDTQGKIAAEQKNIDLLFDKLRKAKKGTTEYKEAKDAILSQYGDYLKGLGKEIETLGDVEKAYKAVAKAARESALARGREAALAEANENYGNAYAKSMGKLQNALIDKAGRTEAVAALQKIQKELRETGTISAKTEQSVRNLLRGSQDYGNSQAWFVTLRKNEQALQDAIERTDALFKLEEKGTEKETQKVKNLGKAYKDAQDDYEKATQKIKEMKENRANYSEKEWEDAQEALKAAKEAYEKLGGDTEGKEKKEYEAAQKTRQKKAKEQQEYLALIEKFKKDRERAEKDLEFAIEQAKIDAMEDGNNKTIRQLNLNFEKQKTELSRAYQDLKQQKIEEEKKLWEANPANKGKIFDTTTVNTEYLKAETEKYEQQLKALEEMHKRSVDDILDSERQAINAYLQEYGTYEQKRLAITEEYEQKISKAKTAGEKLSLQRQMEKALAELDMSKFEKSINWEVLFNDLDKISVEHLNRLKEQLKEALRTDNITAEQAKVISERINAINSQLQTKAKEWQSAFGLVIPELEEMRRLEQEAIEAQDRKEEAQERLNRSLEEELRIRQEIIDLLEQNGITANASEVTATNQDNFLQMMQGMGKDTQQLSDLFSKLGKSEAQVAQNTEALAGAEAEAGASAEAAGGSFATTVAIIDTIVHKINDNIQSMNELLAQMDLADTKFGKGFSKFAESSEYATKAWESLKSGNIMGVANGVYGSLRTLGEALGEWGVAGMGSSDTSLHDDMILLTQSNKDLKMAIDELAKVMEDSAVAEATEIFSQQKSRIEDSIKNTLELMQRAASAYSNGFLGIGGHHSSGSKINDAISSTEWDRISKLLGKSVRSAGDFFSLTSEEMYRVATELTDIYSRIKDLADDGYENAAQFMDEYISYWQQLEELQNAYYEKMTSVSFDTIESDFKSVLMDMDSDVEAFSENFEKYLQQAIINSLVSEKYRPLLEKWYHMFSSYMEDGRLDDWERYNLLNGGSFRNTATGQWESAQGWNSITQQGIDDRNAMRDLFGWGTEDEEEAKEYFSNIRDMWVSTLTDMEADAESWQKEITRIMVEDLVNSLVLGDDFEKWLADWKERYADELAHGMDADRLNALIAEMVEKRKELAEQSQGIMDSLGYTDLMKEIEESEDVFEDLHDNFLDALMDMDTDAEQWGKKIAETLARQIIEQELLNQAFDGMLDEWKQGVADYMNLFGMGSREDEEALNGLKAKIAEIVEKYKELAPMAQEFLEALGLIEEAKPETPFNNLRQSFLSTLLDMKSDAESFRRDLDRTLVQDMIEKFIFDVKMTINGQDFDNFDAYLEDWNRRYLEIFQNGDLTKEQKESQLQALIDELMQEREMLDKASEDLRERLKEIEESVPDSTFKEMTDDWISTLMDFEATAEDWAENVGRMMARKIIEQMIAANMIQPLLDQLQDAFNSAMEVEGATWQSVIQGLAPQIETLKGAFNELQPIVQQILNAFGIFKEEVEEVEEIGDTTFKDLTDSWISTLMDMNATAEDWAESVGRTMAKRIIEEMVAAKFLQPLLDSLQTVFDDAIARGLSMTQVLALLTPELDKMKDTFNEVRPIVEEILNAFGLIKEEVEEIEEEADTTFKDMAGEWASALMDMDMTAEQWAQNVGRKMAQRIIEELVVARLMQPLLDSLQMAFDTALNAVDATWESAIAALSPYIGQLTEAFAELQPIAEQILNSFGIFREEVAEEAKEGFSDLRGAFVSSLMDMEADADKFAKDIARIMTEQMVDRLIEKQFGSQIDALNEAWYNALEAGDTAAMERIRQQLIELQQLCGEAVQPLLDTLAQIEYVPEVVEEEVDETITSMRDDFLNALMDMRAGTQDFANDIRKILTKKMIEKFVLNSQFDAWLESIQSKYDAIFNSSASEEEMADAFERLATEWELKANEMQQMTQRIFDLTGWSDIVERMNSPLTDLRSNFLSALMDMEADAKDFTKEISELLTEAFIDKFVLGDEFEKRLAEWQEQYAAIMKGNYSEEERADLLLQLQNAISAAKEGYAKEAQVIQELMGTYSSPDQQATMNMADKVTYDQFETYLGIAVAQQMATLAGNEIRVQILATLQAMSGITSPNGDTVREIRSTLNTTNEYLLDIKRSNKDILNLFGEKLDNIINKLSDLV